MVNQDVLNYLKEGLKRGFSISVLKQKLIEGGFKPSEVDEAIIELPLPQSPPTFQKKVDFSSVQPAVSQSHLSFFDKLDGALRRPRWLFDKTKEESAKRALAYNLLFMVIPFILLTVAIFSFILYLPSTLGTTPWWTSLISLPSGMVMIFALVCCFVALPLFLFIATIPLHLSAIIFRGSGRFSATYKSVVYSAEPFLLWFPFGFVLMAIPAGTLISLSMTALTLLWSVIIFIFALENYHSYSKARSFFSLIFGGILLLLVLAAIIFLAAMLGPQKLTFN